MSKSLGIGALGLSLNFNQITSLVVTMVTNGSVSPLSGMLVWREAVENLHIILFETLKLPER